MISYPQSPKPSSISPTSTFHVKVSKNNLSYQTIFWTKFSSFTHVSNALSTLGWRFCYTDWLIGIHFMAYYSHYTVGSIYNHLQTANKQGFGHCSRETTVISPHSLPPWSCSPVSGFHQAAGVKWFILPRLSTLFHLLHVQCLPGVGNRTLQQTGQSTTSPKPEWKGNYHIRWPTGGKGRFKFAQNLFNTWRQTY